MRFTDLQCKVTCTHTHAQPLEMFDVKSHFCQYEQLQPSQRFDEFDVLQRIQTTMMHIILYNVRVWVRHVFFY